ncbi:hypothetical protein ABZ119_02885 [Streptomyces sp. NPDC006288]|uniref:hypothetical protein n=1 Tax=Streptomyces sp. NPDC006288 TaxID=3156743 RepID=UPI0033AF3CA7
MNALAEIRAGGVPLRAIGVAEAVPAPAPALEKAFGVALYPHETESLWPKLGAVRAGRL